MYTVLNVSNDLTHCGNIGHTSNDMLQIIEWAKEFHFSAVNFDFRTPSVSSLELKDALHEMRIKPCAFGLYCELFGTDQAFEHGIAEFKVQALYAKTVGCKLAMCYIPPFSEEHPFDVLFRQTINRLGRLKPILLEHNIKIAFEFIGPTETRRSTPYDFIHTIDGVRALIAAAGLYGSAGLKLDVHHWYFSGAGLLDIQHLDLDYILYIELNDGLPGYDQFTMPEFERELPLTTGVTPVMPFLQALKEKGYSGPVSVEPWNAKIKTLPVTTAIPLIKSSLDECLVQVTDHEV
jgi:sugar phosphate isomerase/epimerase